MGTEFADGAWPSPSVETSGAFRHAKYRVERLIGVGAVASVYQGRHRNGNRVAIKVVHPHIAAHRELRDTLLHEGYAANRVDHPGAVRVLDDDTTADGSVFLVMELLEGETLESLWERFGQRLPHEEVARLAHQVLDVLVAAHQQGIVHRDIKPSNLFLTREGRVKVLDFGIARLVERDRTDATGRQAISPIGTPDYMPPEQAAGLPQDVDGRADIWAVGATMFTLLSGCGVHAADTLEDVLAHAATLPVRPLGSVAPAVPDGLASVVDRALAFDRDARWPSAGAMRAALEAVYPTLLATDEASRPSWTFLGGPHSSSALVAARDESMGLSAPRAGLVAPTLAVARRQWGWAAATAALIVVLTIGTLKVVGAGHHDAHDATPLPARFPSSAAGAPLVSAAAERLAPPAAEPVGAAISPNAASTTQTAVPPPEAIFEKDGGARRGRRPTSAEPTPRPACDPPFRTDRMARRIPKPECL